MRAKTILLTGATGYLGSNLLHRLLQQGYNVIVLKRSFSDTFRIDDVLSQTAVYNADTGVIGDVFKNHTIDTIIHCATDYGRKNVDPIQIIEANLILPVKLLEHARAHGVGHFINTDTILDKRIGHYSLSKRQFCDWLHSYQKHLGCTNIALGHFYGSGDDTTKMVSYLSQKLITNATHIDLTEGAQLRNFIHVDDVVAAFLAILAHQQEHRSGFCEFHVCGEENISIRDFVILMQQLSGNVVTELRFGAVPYRENEVMEYSTDVSAIRNIGWKPHYTLRDGIKRMLTEDRARLTE